MLDTKKIKTEWDLSPLYKNDKDPQIEKDKKIVEKKVGAFVKKWKDREDWLKDPKVLKQALDEYESLMSYYSTHGTPGVYLWLRSSLDLSDKEIKAKNNKLNDLSTKLENELEFFSNPLSKVDKKTQKTFVSNPILLDYRHFLESLFENSKYLLSEAEEKIMNLKSDSSHSSWTKMVSEFISKEEREIINDKGKKERASFEQIRKASNYGKTKKERVYATKEFNKILERHADVAEHEINAILQNKKVDDELRGFERPDSARHISDDIDSRVVDAMVSAVTEGFTLPKKYYKLKAKLFKVDHLDYNERNLPVGEIEGNYGFTESAELVNTTLGKLDKEFSDIFESFLYKGQVDVYPKKGKRGGAFCVYFTKTHPVYVLLNHNNTLNDVTTVAHEMGHAINDELMRAQNSLNYGTPLSTAEVASTFMEDFVFDELATTLNERERFILQFEKVNDAVSSIYRQAAAYNFETDLHAEFRKQGYLSKETIGKIFQKNMKAYMGSGVSQDKGCENWWVYWSHFRNFFYVYSYASGLLISKALQRKVRENPEFIEKVKEFLSAGSSDSPKNLFMKMGIDITKPEFWQEGLKEIEDLLKETEKLAKKLGKI